jgi:hypothetical protein
MLLLLLLLLVLYALRWSVEFVRVQMYVTNGTKVENFKPYNDRTRGTVASSIKIVHQNAAQRDTCAAIFLPLRAIEKKTLPRCCVPVVFCMVISLVHGCILGAIDARDASSSGARRSMAL